MIHALIWLLMCAISVITMIYGWGLTPANWGWILFGYLATVILTLLSAAVSED